MELNALPVYDASDNPAGCCPRFNPDGWDDQDLHIKDKLLVKAKTMSLFHIPINMGPVFKRTFNAIEKAHAQDERQVMVLSRDLSAWSAEHYFAVNSAVPDEAMVRMSGDYRTKVFEGAYKNAPKWSVDGHQYHCACICRLVQVRVISGSELMARRRCCP